MKPCVCTIPDESYQLHKRWKIHNFLIFQLSIYQWRFVVAVVLVLNSMCLFWWVELTCVFHCFVTVLYSYLFYLHSYIHKYFFPLRGKMLGYKNFVKNALWRLSKRISVFRCSFALYWSTLNNIPSWVPLSQDMYFRALKTFSSGEMVSFGKRSCEVQTATMIAFLVFREKERKANTNSSSEIMVQLQK